MRLLSLRHSRRAAVTILPLGARVCARVEPQLTVALRISPYP
jgi:hypothetical protein